MDEDISIINTNTRNEKIKNFFIKNKNRLYVLFLALIIILVSAYGYDKYTINKKNEISNKFNLAIGFEEESVSESPDGGDFQCVDIGDSTFSSGHSFLSRAAW